MGEARGELPLAVKNQSMEQKMGPLKLDFTQKSVSYQQLGPGMASMATGKHGDFEDIGGGGELQRAPEPTTVVERTGEQVALGRC